MKFNSSRISQIGIVILLLTILQMSTSAELITVTLTTLSGEPAGWNPGNGTDFEIDDTSTFTGLPAGTHRFHVNMAGGIYDLHFYIENATVDDEIEINQTPTMFPNGPVETDPGADANNVPSGLEWIELNGANVPYCTYFEVNAPSMQMHASIPEPGTLALIGLAGGGVLFIRRFRQD